MAYKASPDVVLGAAEGVEPMSGTLDRRALTWEAAVDGVPTFGLGYGAYGNGRVLSDEASGGFSIGHYVRVRGRQGIALALHGQCATPPAQALDSWLPGDKSRWTADTCEPWASEAPLVPVGAELLYVVDRSGTMDWTAVGSTRTRWLELTDAMSTVLPTLSDNQLGLWTFPELNGSVETNWCGLASAPDVGVDLGTGTSIVSRMVAADPRAGETPTPQVLQSAGAYFAARPSSSERFVVLVTDGLPEPNCGSTLSATVAAISALRGDGIDTFVIGVVGPDPLGDTAGIPALQAGLNQLADAGGRALSGAIRYHEVESAPSMIRALETVTSSATNCVLALGEAPPAAGAVITVDGVVLDTDAYVLDGAELTLLGSTCTLLQVGSVASVRAEITCGTP